VTTTLQLILTCLALLGVSALFGGSLYDAVVLAPNLTGGSAALEHGRLFMSSATPANLFRVLSPLAQLLLLAAVVANWKGPGRGGLRVGALAALVFGDVITFTYPYPRLRLMFTAPLAVEPALLLQAAQQWAAANFVRVALLLGAWLSTLVALMRLGMPERS